MSGYNWEGLEGRRLVPDCQAGFSEQGEAILYIDKAEVCQSGSAVLVICFSHLINTLQMLVFTHLSNIISILFLCWINSCLVFWNFIRF